MRAHPLLPTALLVAALGTSRDAATQRPLAGARRDAPIAEIEAKVDHGFRWFEGRWRLPQEIEYLRRARGERSAPTGAPGPVEAAWFATLSDRRAAEARDRLIDAARRVADPALELAVVRAWQHGRAAASVRMPVAVLGLNLQQTTLVGFRTVPVSFGTGQGRIMLPTTRSISIGTTIAVPLGR